MQKALRIKNKQASPLVTAMRNRLMSCNVRQLRGRQNLFQMLSLVDVHFPRLTAGTRALTPPKNKPEVRSMAEPFKVKMAKSGGRGRHSTIKGHSGIVAATRALRRLSKRSCSRSYDVHSWRPNGQESL